MTWRVWLTSILLVGGSLTGFGRIAAETGPGPLPQFGPPPIEPSLETDGLVEAQPLAPAPLLDESEVAAPAALLQDEPPEAEPIRSEDGAELVRERFPGGQVKIERYVIQDEALNFVNHGPWKMWDVEGNVIAEGEYRHGSQHGTWTAWLLPGEVEMLRRMPYKQYRGPFISRAEFREGELHGTWSILDNAEQVVSEFHFVEGRRHGAWTWTYADGTPMRKVPFREGRIEGEISEWNIRGELLARETFIEGRRLASRQETYADGTPKSEGVFLLAEQTAADDDCWWDCRIAPPAEQGPEWKHGPWKAWHPNGQRQMQGEYLFDVPVGTFTWWHPNGQQALQGSYRDGLQEGDWVWWHENGLKASQGRYVGGEPSGNWVWWDEQGRVAERIDYSQEVETAGLTLIEDDPQ